MDEPLPGATMSMSQLFALTTVVECELCGNRHAPVRTCEEAAIEESIKVQPEG